MKAQKGKSEQVIDKNLSINEEINALVENAEKALQTYVTMDQEQIDKIVYAMTLAGLDHHRELAKLAHEETGRGVYEDKIIKNIFSTEYIWNSIKNEKEKAYPEATMWGNLPAKGFCVRHARNVHFNNIHVETTEADVRPDIVKTDTEGWGDQGDGTYRNPVLNADFSDPDVIRVEDKFYMVASDFHFLGMQVLESEDMVNWHYISQIYRRFDEPGWDSNQHYAGGSWAPAIRYHNGLYYVYFCTPEEGLYMSTASDPHGPWAPLHLVKRVAKWEDPCPFWDDDGQAYLGRSKHGAGPIIVHKMSPDGKQLLDEGVTVYEGPVAEGTKFLKRNGWYFLIIPEGGVGTGWQTVLRSKNIYGPYERKIVLEQGSTHVNGPHQGALVDTPDGQWWFYHFQETPVLGRVVHLQPVRWHDDWVLANPWTFGKSLG